MKKLIFSAYAITFCCLFSISAIAADNYFQYRYGAGEQHCFDHYLVYEYAGVESFAFGATVVLGNDKFILLNPAIYYRLTKNLELGMKYEHTSFDTDKFGPVIRWREEAKGLSLIVDITQYFDLHTSANKTDVWAQVSTAQQSGWYFASEIWYYRIVGDCERINLRPVKVGYRHSSGIAPFWMYEFEARQKESKIYFGLEVLF